jgi:mannosyltransferase
MTNAVRERARRGFERPGARPWLDWTLIIAPAVTLAVTVWGIGASAYSGDELDTVSAVSRSVPQLIRLLGHVDAVHGLYYLLMWPVAAVAGTGDVAARFPSALAMAAAALGITAIGRRLVSRRAGLWAGLTFAALPVVSQQGQDARPYAIVTAAAALASYLFIRAVQDPRPRWFAGYCLSLVLLGYMQMFGLLLVAAHVVTLTGLGWPQRNTAHGLRWQAPRWLLTFAAAGVAVTPLVIMGWVQRGAISWINRPGLATILAAARVVSTGSTVSVIVLGELAALGVACSGRLSAAWPLARDDTATDAGRAIGWLAVPWLLLPPAVLLAVSEVMPVYNARYITFCLPAVTLLVGSGIAALRQPVRIIAFGVVLVLAASAQVAIRVPVNGVLVASAFLKAHERPGDAIVYPYPMIPPWSTAYPEGFAALRDLSLAHTSAVEGTLYGKPVPQAVLAQRERDVSRIWVVETKPATHTAYIVPAFHRTHVWRLSGGLKVWLYTRGR